LEAPCCHSIQLFNEFLRIAGGAPSKVPSQDQLCVPFDCDKAIGIPAQRVTVHIALFFAPDVAPNFIALNVPHRDVADCVFQKPLASLASKDQDVKDCIAVGFSDSLNGADGAPLDKQPDDLSDLLSQQVSPVQLVGSLTVGLVALAAAETLIPFPVFPKFLALGFAIMAGHRSCLSRVASR
jgi:hypothetical protein